MDRAGAGGFVLFPWAGPLIARLLVVVSALWAWHAHGQTLTHEFTYQGQLIEGGQAVDGATDMIVTLWDGASGGAQIGPTLTFDGVGGNPPPIDVRGGVFEIGLDFGGFADQARWLELQVRHPAGGGSYTTLFPRQRIAAAPQAVFALAAGRVLDPCAKRPEDFGARRDGLTDDSSAFEAAFAAMSGSACNILELSPGTYRLSRTVRPMVEATIRGPRVNGVGGARPPARLRFDAGVTGVIVDFPFELVMEHVDLVSAGGADGPGPVDGILAGSPVRLEGVWIGAFSGDGIRIEGSFEGDPPTFADRWRILGGQSSGNGGSGLVVAGTDANGGLADALVCDLNQGWGIEDVSFMGNTYSACSSAGNDRGSYAAGGSTSRCVFIGCSSGDGTARIDHPSKWIGGLGAVGGTGFIVADGLGAIAPYSLSRSANPLIFENNNDAAHPEVNFVAGGAGASLFELWAKDDLDGHGSRRPWRMRYRKNVAGDPYFDEGWYRLDHGSLDDRVALRLSGEEASVGPGHVWLSHHFLGRNSPTIRIGAGVVPPTLSTAADPWMRGSVFWNSAQSAGGWAGWTCTNVDGAGNLTWKRFGQVEP